MNRTFLATLTLCLSLIILPNSSWATTPPPAQEVFRLKASVSDPNTLLLQWTIRDGFYLYKKRIHITASPNANFHLGPVRCPKAIEMTDKQDRSYQVYQKELTLPVAILGQQGGESYLKIQYQGCAKDGFCYPPQTKHVRLTINQTLALTSATLETITPPTLQKEPQAEKNRFEAVLSSHNIILIVLGFLVFGLLLAFTPCVLPMVPVLSGIIVGHGKNLTTRKAFFLSLSYVLSMSVTYAIVGVVVALMGQNLQIAMQSPWVISAFSLIFVLLSLSMFGFYELQLPVSWQNRLASYTRSHEGGHYFGAAIMGCLSTLVISPCVTAPLIGVLGYIAQTGDMFLGGIALFSLGLGMGLPLLLIGTSAGKLLPKAGGWMNDIKGLFGIILLAMAIYLMARVLPAALIMFSWSALLVFSGLYLGALTRSQSWREKFTQGLGILALAYGLLILFGASQGNTNPLLPLVDTQKTQASSLHEQTIRTPAQLDKALRAAKGKPVVLDFYADWCTACQVYETTTLQEPQITSRLKDFVFLRVDVTANNSASKTLMQRYQVVAPPTFIFLNANGQERSELRIVGEVSSKAFCATLMRAAV